MSLFHLIFFLMFLLPQVFIQITRGSWGPNLFFFFLINKQTMP